MQLRIARILNNLLLIITVIILALVAGFFLINKFYPEYKQTYLIGAVMVSIAMFWFFKWMESGWDKRVIAKMAMNGHVALANISSAKRVLPMRDSSFIKYWLYEFVADLTTPDLKTVRKVKFWEKMNYETDAVPKGSVIVTYDPDRPSQIFIVPNVLIGNIPPLMPKIRKIENSAQVKYLDAYYNKGMVLRSMRDSVAEHAQANEKMEEK